MDKRQKILVKLPEALLPWYSQNKRDLPWRSDTDPYHILVSEVMLQQTRVEAVKGYYRRFINELPDVASLAKADDSALYKLWEGLGYYSRVRNLKRAAQAIVKDYAGLFPKNYKQILSLPGVGQYTAGALCSIAFNHPIPAVDGNVLRVVSRLLNDPTPIDFSALKKQVNQDLKRIYPKQAGDFTQALMELGATLCGPNKEADCDRCPCRNFCLGYQAGTQNSLPVKSPKKERRQENMTVFILSCDGKFALERRPDEGLLAGLWQFPNVSGKLAVADAIAFVEEIGLKPKEIIRQVEKKHIFTHIQWNMRGMYMEVGLEDNAYTWLDRKQIEDTAALPTAFRKFFEEIGYSG